MSLSCHRLENDVGYTEPSVSMIVGYENIAVALNMLLPGAGDIYCGKTGRGVVMFIVTVIALSIKPIFILIMWPILMYDAKIETENYNKTL